MKKLVKFAVVPLLAAFFVQPAGAVSFKLFDGLINVNGTIVDLLYDPVIPDYIDTSSFDLDTGLGAISVKYDPGIQGQNTGYVGLFVDHEINYLTDGGLNEFGSTSGAPDVGQSWEIDEPGFAFGDIYDNFLASSLDNSNAIPESFPDDVSMAMAFDFLLGIGQVAVIDFILSDSPIDSTFKLIHSDADSQIPGPNESPIPSSIYFASNLDIRGDSPAPVPESSTIILACVGFISLLAAKKKVFVKK